MRTAWLLALTLTCCHGGIHRRDEWQVIADVSAGVPAGEFLFSSTGADAPEIGVRVGAASFMRDRTAVVGALSYRYYDLNDGVSAFEAQIGPRYYPPIDFHLGKTHVGPFVDAFGGIFRGADNFPEAGTDTNVTLAVGGGLEVVLSDHASVLLGYRFRHLSNAGGNEPDNPGYNANEFFLGLGWRW